MIWFPRLNTMLPSRGDASTITSAPFAAAAAAAARVIAVTWGFIVAVSPSPAHAGTPANLVVTDIRDVAATVSWTTSQSEVGYVQYSPAVAGSCTGATFASTQHDDRGPGTSSSVHYVVLTGLLPSTTYCYRAVSGSTTASPTVLTTLSTTDSPAAPKESMVGQVTVNSVGAPDFIIYATVSVGSATSATISALGKWSDGWFGFQLAPTTADGASPLAFTDASTLTLRAVGGTAGSGQLTTTVGAARTSLVITATQQALTITSVSPSVVWPGGGTPITITGTGFASGATVSIGAKPATNVVVAGSTSITALTPSVSVFGDVTGDGLVKAADASCTLRTALRLAETPACAAGVMPSLAVTVSLGGSYISANGLLPVRATDVTGDGRTSAADSSCILRLALRIARTSSCPAPAP
jgi:hypothetical protein